jgi:hydroxymethylpyrimidine/phosphomethylpyrimidine kinase
VIPNALAIAGLDPSGGAGILADVKTFSALGAYGTAVLTAVTAQSTRGVTAVRQLDPELVTAQLETLLDDVRIDAVKIGMIGSAEMVRAVAAVLRRHRPPHVVLDPVMVAKSGDRLLDLAAVHVLRTELLPLCDLVTPNLPEAADLLGEPEARDEASMQHQLERLMALAPAVLLKGGHLEGEESIDLLAVDGCRSRLHAPRLRTQNTHGTGCTLSSAIAALRPRGASWLEAVQEAKNYVTAAIGASDQLDVGSGHGPLHHFAHRRDCRPQ